jgi:hypothetical protein
MAKTGNTASAALHGGYRPQLVAERLGDGAPGDMFHSGWLPAVAATTAEWASWTLDLALAATVSLRA